jgi:chromosome segregation ATPase
MVNMKVSCLRKGIAIGRIGQALHELHMQVDIAGETDIYQTHGALAEIKGSLRPLKKNLRTSPEEVKRIGEGVQKISKLLKGKNITLETMTYVKAELREVRENFRKAVQAGFSDCGAPRLSDYDKTHLTQDHAHYTDTHPSP